ncbi:SDR family NAD(P)-dependent oxidoreductase [bacterium]|nr:SDR family NAD(P)-dependent oxidoreductase [bacterium]
MKNFNGKHVLITGAASGIGRETAMAFAHEGAILCLADIDAEGVRQTKRLICGLGGSARAFHCDVSDADSVKTMADAIHQDIDCLDILMNNAGLGCAGHFLETSLETWQTIMNVNVMGVLNGCHAFLPKMIERGNGGHVVNTSSSSAFVATQELPLYAASKSAVLGFSESLRADMAKHAIGVTAICPGIVNTPIVANAIVEGGLAAMGRRDKIEAFYRRRNYQPSRVAREVLKAVKRNVGVKPISPEAWGMYYCKRLAPCVVDRLLTSQGPFYQRISDQSISD